MFLTPLEIFNQRQQNMEQTYILTETICLADSVCNKGILYSELYMQYINKISDGSKLYDVELEHIQNFYSEELELNNYTEQILANLDNEGCEKFSIGDIFRIQVKDKNNNLIVFYGGCIKDEDY